MLVSTLVRFSIFSRANTFCNLKKCKFSGVASLNLSGVLPPIATPFDETERIDFQSLAENFSKWNAIPFKGYVVLGSNGEAAYLETEEKVQLVKEAKQLAADDRLILAGCGCESTRATVGLAERMAAVGADALLVVTPSFFKGSMSGAALYRHYTQVADASPLPVILYSVPANTTIDLAPDVIVRLAAHPNIIGIKESGGQVAKMGGLVHRTAQLDFQVLAGSAGYMLPAYTVGCVGVVAALANVLGAECCELDRMFRCGEQSAATRLQQRLVAPNAAVTAQLGVAGLKRAMQLWGFYGGRTRSPLLPLTSEQEEQLIAAFSDFASCDQRK